MVASPYIVDSDSLPCTFLGRTIPSTVLKFVHSEDLSNFTREVILQFHNLENLLSAHLPSSNTNISKLYGRGNNHILSKL